MQGSVEAHDCVLMLVYNAIVVVLVELQVALNTRAFACFSAEAGIANEYLSLASVRSCFGRNTTLVLIAQSHHSSLLLPTLPTGCPISLGIYQIRRQPVQAGILVCTPF